MKLTSNIVSPLALSDALIAANAAVVSAGEPSLLAQDDMLLSGLRTDDFGPSTPSIAAHFADGGNVFDGETREPVNRLALKGMKMGDD